MTTSWVTVFSFQGAVQDGGLVARRRPICRPWTSTSKVRAGLLVLVHTCVRFVVLTPMFMKLQMLRNINLCASEYLETVPGSWMPFSGTSGQWSVGYRSWVNPLTPELNPSAQRSLARFFTGDFASWTVHFVNMCMKNQRMQQLFIQLINYMW
jgi:hypothetical protein